MWVTLQNEIAAESNQGMHVVSDEAGYHIHHEASAEVVGIPESLVK